MSDPIQQQLDTDVENLSITQLNELGNQAIKQGLIAGHGHHQGQYEIIREGKILTMPPKDAITFLQQLIQPVTEEK
ncbi:hypothetical protein [Leptothoe spongobia]|uniref:Uncharacterized protein n=1 Tax=Leptothoe spongobia TAU-MAC 1115 TaxID=1967444 RepID=A0A947DHB7_9CYAN|nr:hypothetical protein [Leptothoe spongobia]MBT9316654.1 hypothetical protein [Leptothoe spongobia TAU-MAC 1115]